jgi:hypothetical protein
MATSGVVVWVKATSNVACGQVSEQVSMQVQDEGQDQAGIGV